MANNSFSGMAHTPPTHMATSYEQQHMKRPRSNSISGRLRSASDLEERGLIDKFQKGVLKVRCLPPAAPHGVCPHSPPPPPTTTCAPLVPPYPHTTPPHTHARARAHTHNPRPPSRSCLQDLIISGDESLQSALDHYEHGDPSYLEALMERGVLNRRSSLDLLEDLDMGMGSFNMGSVGVGVSVAGGAGVGIGIGGVGVGVGSTAKWGRSASPRGDDSQFPLDDLHVDSGFFTGDSSGPSAAEQRVGMGAHSSLGGQGGGMGHMGGVDMPGQHVYSGGNMREHSGSFGFSSLGPHDSMAVGMVGGSVVGAGGGGGVHPYGVPGHGLGQQHMAPHPGAHHAMGMIPAPAPPPPSSGMVPIPGAMGHAGGGVGAVAGAAGDGSEVHRRFIGAYSPDARRRRIER